MLDPDVRHSLPSEGKMCVMMGNSRNLWKLVYATKYKKIKKVIANLDLTILTYFFISIGYYKVRIANYKVRI